MVHLQLSTGIDHTSSHSPLLSTNWHDLKEREAQLLNVASSIPRGVALEAKTAPDLVHVDLYRNHYQEIKIIMYCRYTCS